MLAIAKKFYLKHKELISNILWRSVQFFTKQFLSFYIFLLAAYFFSPYDFGHYNYTLSIIFFLIIFSDLGLSTATSTFTVDYSHREQHKVPELFISILFLLSTISFAISTLFLIFGRLIFGSNFTDVLYLLPLVFLIPATSLLDGIYRGLGRFKKLSVIFFSCSAVSMIGIFFLVKYYGIVGAYLSQTFYYAMVLVFLLANYRDYSFKVNSKIIKEVSKYSVIIGIANIGFFFYSRVDSLFLGSYGFIKEVGYFEIVNKILILILTPLSVIPAVIAPVNTKIYLEKKYEVLLKSFYSYLILSLGLSVVIVTVLFFSYGPIFSLFPKYNSSSMLLIARLMTIVFFTQILNSFFPEGFAIPTGYANISMYLLLIFGALNVILDYLFINIFGFIGVVYGTILTKCTTDFLFIYIYHRSLKKRIAKTDEK